METSKTLRQQLIGSWNLMSYVETDVDSGEEYAPLSQKPKGIILYTPDGYMSAQIQAPERKLFGIPDMYRGTTREYFDAGRTYLAYSGRFFVDETAGKLTHEMSVAFFPNWSGQRQARIIELVENTLLLSTDGPQRFNGSMKTAKLLWTRAEKNN